MKCKFGYFILYTDASLYETWRKTDTTATLFNCFDCVLCIFVYYEVKQIVIIKKIKKKKPQTDPDHTEQGNSDHSAHINKDIFLNISEMCRDQTLFECDNGTQSIPYTLTCNHHADCQDKSDELFCNFPCQVCIEKKTLSLVCRYH